MARRSDGGGGSVARGSHGAIIVGVDGSLDATAALAWALRHAQVVGLAVCVVHAWLPDEPSSPRLAGQRVDRERARSEPAAARRVHAAISAASARVPAGDAVITRLAAHGEPGEVLVALSKDGALLVVGATGSGASSGFHTPAIGSTARYALRHAWCPVTVVPSVRLRGEHAAQPYAAVPQARLPGAGS
jgi:nucleotide-binding universal stress UspA family protein